ncbi:hypothetical protein EL22_15490 [Halostagnicola sp. A56]|uniref:DUF4330 family protein n=1 Tax=Halostagnicola sp. A56 TaxID=1495067 RepID=UPI0004A073BC|nr:DUF4330 family protein [Halostagnicola sp. A56]KDE59888.1 hypothetical protein EL22_15490 [Halostagnicola sp. A56]
MELIDENGNLFGVVNVIDALVVVLALAVVAAGIAVIGVLGVGGGPAGNDDEAGASSTETKYATLSLGTQSVETAESITAGDEMMAGDERLSITDVYAIRTSSDTADVTVRTEVVATHHENGTVTFDGDQFASGRNVSVQTDEYDVNGSVDAVESNTTTLSTTETEVLFEDTVGRETAEQIRAGDESAIGNETVATLESTSAYPIGDDKYRVTAGATLTTLETDDGVRYGQQPVESGATIPFATDSYTLEPATLETGTTDEPGEATTTTVELDLDELSDREADLFEPGLTETTSGETRATVTSVDREPATVVVEAEDGSLNEQAHPTKDDVTLTVELETRETDLGTEFKGETLRTGDTVYLDFGVTTVEERAWVVD